MKKYLNVVLVIVLMIVVVGGGTILAKDDTISKWAVEEVEEAISKDIVPTELQRNYQMPIKRYEYTLLALRLYEKTGQSINVRYPFPFSDIRNHPYEQELILAYNAGLISGYTDRTFKPDAEITRAEVAVLITNLVKEIKSQDDLPVKLEYVFSDYSSIGKWAKGAIDYCYENDIIMGVGKDAQGLTIIKPNDTTSVEQSIAMIHRLGKTENIYNQYQLGTIKVTSYTEDNERTTINSEIINDFAVYVGEGLAKEIQSLANSGEVEVTLMDHKNAYLNVYNEGVINISRYDTALTIYGRFSSLEEDKNMKLLTKLMNQLGEYPELNDEMNRLIKKVNEENVNTQYSIVGKNDIITVNKIKDLNNNQNLFFEVVFECNLN